MLLISFFHWLSVLPFDTLMERFLERRAEPCETSMFFLSTVGSRVKLLLNSAFSNFVIHLQTFAFAPNTILAVDVCLCLCVGCFIACCLSCPSLLSGRNYISDPFLAIQ